MLSTRRSLKRLRYYTPPRPMLMLVRDINARGSMAEQGPPLANRCTPVYRGRYDIYSVWADTFRPLPPLAVQCNTNTLYDITTSLMSYMICVRQKQCIVNVRRTICPEALRYTRVHWQTIPDTGIISLGSMNFYYTPTQGALWSGVPHYIRTKSP